MADDYVHRTMSKQLTIAAAFSIFASSALALFAPGSAHPSSMLQTGATTGIAAPLTAELSFLN
jgi:hypothetical protein